MLKLSDDNMKKRCVFDSKRICEEHKCPAKVLKLKVLKWRYIEKKKCFGNMRITENIYQCTVRKRVLVEPKISPTVQHSDISDDSIDQLSGISGQQQSVQDKISMIQRDWLQDTREDGYRDVIGRQQR